jgi:hypothetical protein
MKDRDETRRPGTAKTPGDSGTSGNREESMNESDKDEFGKSGRQNPATSGTESLGGEAPDSNDRRGPGGVEGGEN